jgi:hypothetical protein
MRVLARLLDDRPLRSCRATEEQCDENRQWQKPEGSEVSHPVIIPRSPATY